MSAEPSQKTPWILVFSFALNGLLIGILAMTLMLGGSKQRGGSPSGGIGGVIAGDRGLARAIIESAPASERPEFRRIMGDAWRDARSDRAVIREAQKKISEAVQSGQLDKAAIEAAFKEWREADMRVKTKVQVALVDVLSSLPEENLAELAEILKEYENRRGRFRDRLEEGRDRFRDRPRRPPPRD